MTGKAAGKAAAEGSKKRKRTKSWITNTAAARPMDSPHKRAKKDEPKADLVNLVLSNDVDGLRKDGYGPPEPQPKESITRMAMSEREEQARENPLYVAAKIGRAEAAQALLDFGWQMSRDSTALGVDDDYMARYTPLGVAFEKNNAVLEVFMNHISKLEGAK
mmetsp:Transcript_26365/g.73685  ORF Transcript_26365/g.73685 Transcript_26365/m.73685 type:complete len:162 (+) Transcript_26365:96-581(+)